MIKRITVKGLFGLYDYDIPFSQKPAVKILTGPNGYGKTTLLLAISHLYKGNFWFFHFLDFEIISVYLQENGFEQSIAIKKQPVLLDEKKTRKVSTIQMQNYSKRLSRLLMPVDKK